MNPINLSQPTDSRWVVVSRIPRPILIFAALIVLLAGIKAVSGGSNRPDSVARAVGDGLMSVFQDDEGLKNLTLIFTKNGSNKAGTAEIRDFGAGLGGMFTGQMRAGGELYFHNYRHASGVILNGGPLDVELSNATGQGEKAARYRVQGSVAVSGSDQPAAVQIEFISHRDAYDVSKIAGDVRVNGTVTTLQP